MARSKKHSSRSIVLHPKVAVEVTEARFREFESLRHLDVARLSRAASARIEVGYFETGCCSRAVHAVVKKGKVTKLELEPCEGKVRMTSDLKKVVEAAAKKLAAGRGGRTPLPVPVSEFLAAPLIITVDVMFCFQICCFGYCITCCIDTEDDLQNFCDWFDMNPVVSPD